MWEATSVAANKIKQTMPAQKRTSLHRDVLSMESQSGTKLMTWFL
jgi:hypothetical protein